MTNPTPDGRRSYEAPQIILREDLKQITLYTGCGDNDTGGGGPWWWWWWWR